MNMPDSSNIVAEVIFPSIFGVWKRDVAYSDGTHAVFVLQDDDGEPRKATLDDIDAYYGSCELLS